MDYQYSEVINGFTVCVSSTRDIPVGKRAAGRWIGEAFTADGKRFAGGDFTSPNILTHKAAATRLARKFGILDEEA
jgi:hypothetical protein